MTGEQLDILESVMDEVASKIEKYAVHLQPTILQIFWAELHGAPSSIASAESDEFRTQGSNGSSQVSPAGSSSDWDFRRCLDQLAVQHDLDLKSPYDYEYALIVSHILQYQSPAGFDGDTITRVHVKDAWKHADRNLPTRLREPLSEATKKGLLQRANGKPGYTLTPKGENHVKKFLASGNSS